MSNDDRSRVPPPLPRGRLSSDHDAEYRLRSLAAHTPEPAPAATFRDEFVVPVPDVAEEARLLPPEGLSPEQRRRYCVANAAAEPAYVDPDDRPLTQFSLLELMVIMTFLAVGFAIMYYLPPGPVAGVLGILALGGQILLMQFPPENRHIRLGAWTLLVMYFVTVTVALVIHISGWNGP